mgnify:CR=1 FL=1
MSINIMGSVGGQKGCLPFISVSRFQFLEDYKKKSSFLQNPAVADADLTLPPTKH